MSFPTHHIETITSIDIADDNSEIILTTNDRLEIRLDVVLKVSDTSKVINLLSAAKCEALRLQGKTELEPIRAARVANPDPRSPILAFEIEFGDAGILTFQLPLAIGRELASALTTAISTIEHTSGLQRN